MSFIDEVKKRFGTSSYFEIWEAMTRDMFGNFDNLLHPCTTNETQLKKQLPAGVPIKDILEKVSIKQKDIAKRLDLPLLPSDRQPGLLGQAALYEVLSEGGYDLSFYVNAKWINIGQRFAEGFALLQILCFFQFLRVYYDAEPLDMVKYLFESINPSEHVGFFKKNWLYRVISNALATRPSLIDQEDGLRILKQVVKIQDSRGVTISRVAEWTGKNRRDAEFLQRSLAMSGITHFSSPVMRNVGITTVSSESTKLEEEPAYWKWACTSLKDNRECFLNFRYVWKEDAGVPYSNHLASTYNFDNYDSTRREWTLPNSRTDEDVVQNPIKLFKNSDFTIPTNTIPPTKRDILILALLTSMPGELSSEKNKYTIQRLIGCGIPKKDAEQGLRNVHRKNLVHHVYRHTMWYETENMLILFSDSADRTIPFISDIVPSLPRWYFLTNDEFTHGNLLTKYPPYLSQRVRSLIANSISEHDLNAEAFIGKAYKGEGTANLLALIPDE